jgi:hypothetical protein
VITWSTGFLPSSPQYLGLVKQSKKFSKKNEELVKLPEQDAEE